MKIFGITSFFINFTEQFVCHGKENPISSFGVVFIREVKQIITQVWQKDYTAINPAVVEAYR